MPNKQQTGKQEQNTFDRIKKSTDILVLGWR